MQGVTKDAANCGRCSIRSHATPASIDDVPLENAPEPICEDASFTEAQSRAALRELVRTLPEAQREIVLLRFAQDLTLREIAEITELPLRTVQSRLRAALKNLRTIYEKEAER